MGRIILCILCALCLIAAGPQVGAVEKKEKKPAQQLVEKKEVPKGIEKQPAQKAGKQSAIQPPKKYDSFVDRNKNGIDDRQERLREKAPAKPETTKQEKKK